MGQGAFVNWRRGEYTLTLLPLPLPFQSSTLSTPRAPSLCITSDSITPTFFRAIRLLGAVSSILIRSRRSDQRGFLSIWRALQPARDSTHSSLELINSNGLEPTQTSDGNEESDPDPFIRPIHSIPSIIRENTAYMKKKWAICTLWKSVKSSTSSKWNQLMHNSNCIV